MSSSSDDNASADDSSSSDAQSNSNICNFHFPKFLTDPVDVLLQENAAQDEDNNNLSPELKHLGPASSGGVKDWELQDAILGQYLILDEEDNFEAV